MMAVPANATVLLVDRHQFRFLVEEVEDIAEREYGSRRRAQLVVDGANEFVILRIINGETVAERVVESSLPLYVEKTEALRLVPQEGRRVLALVRLLCFVPCELERLGGHDLDGISVGGGGWLKVAQIID